MSPRRRRRTLQDPEVLELLRDEPELLALADAVAATRTHRHAPVALLVLVAVCAGAVAIVAPWRSGSPGIVDAARAAIGAQPVVHSVVAANSPVDQRIELRTGRTRSVRVSVETWSDTARRRVRSVIRHDGLVVADVVAPAATRAVPGLLGGERLFSTRYREALDNRRAHVLKRGRFAGHDAVWLDIGFRGRQDVVIIDAHSFLPLAFQEAAASTSPVIWSVENIDSVPRRASDFRTRQRFTAGSGRILAERPTTAAEAKSVTGFGPVFAGRVLGRYRADSYTLQTLTQTVGDQRRRTRGLLVTYRDSHGRSLRISQASSPQVAYGFMRGALTFNLNSVSASVLDLARVGPVWVGQRRFRSLYLTIQAGERSSVIAAARALQPLR
jgi:hypothetical protein